MTVDRPLARAAPERARHSRFLLAVLAVTSAQLLLRGWSAAGGWFFADDFWWHDIVARNSLGAVAGLSLGGHYSPLTYIPYWVLTWLSPYDWSSRVIVMLVTLMGINLGVLAVCRRLWTSRGPQLVTYVLWAFSSLAAPSWLWYSQFSMLGALLLTSTWTLWAYLRALHSRRSAHTLLAVVFLAASLFTQERMVVMAVLLLAFLLIVCRPSISGLMWRGRSLLWGASLSVLAVWGLVYASLPSPGSSSPQVLDAVSIATGMVRISALPALAGGPWVLQNDAVYARAVTPWVLQVTALVVMAAVVWWSLRRDTRAWRPWSVLATGILVDALAIALVRGGSLGEAAVGDFRYFSDLAVLAPILLVSAFVAPGESPAFGAAERKAAIALISVYAASTLVTAVPLGLAWRDSVSRPVVESARAALETSGPIEVMDRVMPTTVVNEELMQQRFASRVFSIIDTEAVFDAPSTDPWWIDDRGRLVPGGLVHTRRSPGSGDCVYVVRGVDTTWIPLAAPTDYFDWGMRLDYSAGTPVTLVVTDGRDFVTISAPAGRQALYVPFPGIAGRVGVHLTDPRSSLCIDAVTAGRAGPGRP